MREARGDRAASTFGGAVEVIGGGGAVEVIGGGGAATRFTSV
jgi:hypothetical protein